MAAKLHPDLFLVFEWTAAAGELAELRGLTDPAALRAYAEQSAANYAEHIADDNPAGGAVYFPDVLDLAAWLRGLTDEEFRDVLAKSK